MTGLSISDVVERTGVAEGTLRMWERRHGFPAPARAASGHRRYAERDVELVRRVVAERDAGLSLAVAIERARARSEAPPASLYAALRRSRPDLEPRDLPQRTMLAMSRAIEDESLSRAERPLLFASFQRERFYRRSEQRWRALARGAELAVVLADFERARTPRGAPAEVPVDRDHPLDREWAIVCDGERHAVCLVGWEPPASDPSAPSSARHFEAIWSVEPAVVREAARICAAITATQRPALVEPVAARLDGEPGRPAEEQLRLAAAVTNRALSYLA